MMAERVHAEAVQLALLPEEPARAEDVYKEIRGPFGAAFHYPHLPLEGAMLLIAQGEKTEAAGLLAQRYREAEADRAQYAQIEVRILQSMAAEGETQAVELLSDAIHRA